MNKAIGILGGMGPEATVQMYKTLTEMSSSVFGARNNNDFPEITVYSIPVPDFISSDCNRDIALEMLKKRASRFNKSSTLCFSIACNTAHVLLDELKETTDVPLISMIEEVCIAVEFSSCKKVGILASPLTLRYGLYQKTLKKRNVRSIIPSKSDIKLTEQIIRNVIEGKILQSDKAILRGIADRFKKRGADCIILGCTEIPLVFPKRYPLLVFNSIEILSLALLRKYYESHKMSLRI